MTTTDWILDIVLILIVVRQIRRAPIDRRFIIIPAAIVFFVAHKYLDGLPSGGTALLMTVAALALGTVLGVAGGLLTKVDAEGGKAYAHAGFAAAGLWIASMTARLGFIVWITHQPGATDLAHFSAEHGITSANAWQTALVLLALSEVIARVGTIVVRGQLAVAAEKRAQVVAPQHFAHI